MSSPNAALFGRVGCNLANFPGRSGGPPAAWLLALLALSSRGRRQRRRASASAARGG